VNVHAGNNATSASNGRQKVRTTMATVYADVQAHDVEIEPGIVVECTTMHCLQCDIEASSAGVSQKSRAECGRMLRQFCPLRNGGHCINKMFARSGQ